MNEQGTEFPTRLREARNLRGLEQAALGEKAGLPASSISHFEAGRRKPSLDNLKRLADALDVSIDYLLGRTDNLSAHLDAAAFRDEDRMTNDDRDLIDGFRQFLAERKKGPQ